MSQFRPPPNVGHELVPSKGDPDIEGIVVGPWAKMRIALRGSQQRQERGTETKQRGAVGAVRRHTSCPSVAVLEELGEKATLLPHLIFRRNVPKQWVREVQIDRLSRAKEGDEKLS